MLLPNGEVVDPPHSLKPVEECFLDQVEILAIAKASLLSDGCFSHITTSILYYHPEVENRRYVVLLFFSYCCWFFFFFQLGAWGILD